MNNYNFAILYLPRSMVWSLWRISSEPNDKTPTSVPQGVAYLGAGPLAVLVGVDPDIGCQQRHEGHVC